MTSHDKNLFHLKKALYYTVYIQIFFAWGKHLETLYFLLLPLQCSFVPCKKKIYIYSLRIILININHKTSQDDCNYQESFKMRCLCGTQRTQYAVRSRLTLMPRLNKYRAGVLIQLGTPNPPPLSAHNFWRSNLIPFTWTYGFVRAIFFKARMHRTDLFSVLFFSS